MGMGKILRTNDLDDGDDDSQHTANKVSRWKKQCLLIRDRVPKDPYRRRHGPAEEGRMTLT